MAQVQGKIVQCIGAVVDVEFPRDQMPKVYDALKLEGSALTLEVQQQLGDGIVRTIALGSSGRGTEEANVPGTHFSSLYSSVVERQSCKLKVPGSIPGLGISRLQCNWLTLAVEPPCRGVACVRSLASNSVQTHPY